MEAEVKSEATGGRVSVETKDQKVWLPAFPGVAPLPHSPHPRACLSSALCVKGVLRAYRGERLRSVGSYPPATPRYDLPGRC